MISIIFTFFLVFNNDSTFKDAIDYVNQDPGVFESDRILHTGWYHIIDSGTPYKRKLDKSEQSYYLDTNSIVSQRHFKNLEIRHSKADNHSILIIRFDSIGTKKWQMETQTSINKYFGFIYNNKLIFIAKVNSQIDSGVSAINSKSYSRKELRLIKAGIEHEMRTRKFRPIVNEAW